MCICLVAKHVTSFLANSQSCLWDRDLVPATCLLRPSGLNPYCQKQGWGRVDPQEVTVEVAETSGISVNLSVSLSGCPSSAESLKHPALLSPSLALSSAQGNPSACHRPFYVWHYRPGPSFATTKLHFSLAPAPRSCCSDLEDFLGPC